jgi:hypothetical protein
MRNYLNASPAGLLTLASIAAAAPFNSNAATLMVGPQQQYTTIASAIAASQDGDTVAVQSGTYTNDFAEISTMITLTAVGGRVIMNATEDLPNEKGILITDTDVSITGFTFVGAHIPASEGQNGAGIRYQGGNLSLTNCYIHNNQEGILANPDPTGTITITNSEFAHNGDQSGGGAGYTHNIYIGAVALFDIEGSYVHNANVGHEIKSRALATIVNNTRIVDGPTGTASYSIDLPNGGAATISNDEVEQGPDSVNGIIISYGEEGNVPPGSSLQISNTMIENDLTAHAPIGVVNDTSIVGTLTGVEVYGLTADQITTGSFGEDDYTMLPSEPQIAKSHPF